MYVSLRSSKCLQWPQVQFLDPVGKNFYDDKIDGNFVYLKCK